VDRLWLWHSLFSPLYRLFPENSRLFPAEDERTIFPDGAKKCNANHIFQQTNRFIIGLTDAL
jgi:hypothetical protein